jgi:hypothetical protein
VSGLRLVRVVDSTTKRFGIQAKNRCSLYECVPVPRLTRLGSATVADYPTAPKAVEMVSGELGVPSTGLKYAAGARLDMGSGCHRESFELLGRPREGMTAITTPQY